MNYLDSIVVYFSTEMLIAVYVIPLRVLELHLRNFLCVVVGGLPYTFMDDHEYEDDDNF